MKDKHRKRVINRRVFLLFIGGIIFWWLEFEFFEASHYYEDTELVYDEIQFASFNKEKDSEGDVDAYRIEAVNGEKYYFKLAAAKCFSSGKIHWVEYGDTVKIGYVENPEYLDWLKTESSYSFIYEGEDFVDRQCAIDGGFTYHWYILGAIGFLSLIFISKYRHDAERDEARTKKKD